MYVGDYISKGKAGKLITPDIRNQCRKMVYPGIGLRLGFGGYQAKGYQLKMEVLPTNA